MSLRAAQLQALTCTGQVIEGVGAALGWGSEGFFFFCLLVLRQAWSFQELFYF